MKYNPSSILFFKIVIMFSYTFLITLFPCFFLRYYQRCQTVYVVIYVLGTLLTIYYFWCYLWAPALARYILRNPSAPWLPPRQLLGEPIPKVIKHTGAKLWASGEPEKKGEEGKVAHKSIWNETYTSCTLSLLVVSPTPQMPFSR